MKRMLVISIVLIALVAISFVARNWLREDKWFDRGGAWDATTSKCTADGKEIVL